MPDIPLFGVIIAIGFAFWFFGLVLPSNKKGGISRLVGAAPLMTAVEQRTIQYIENALPTSSSAPSPTR